MSLPSEYKRLEYIESSGTQYIDTGFKHNQDTRVVMKAQVTTTPSTHAWLFEGRTQEVSHKSVFLLSGSKWTTDYLNGVMDGHRISYSSVGVTDLLNIDYNKNVVNINGSTHTYTAQTFQSSCNLAFFAANTAGTISGYISARIWQAQIYDNGTLIRDFIPCQTSSGEVGLWDDVNSKFYSNAGTGAFIAGPVAEYVKLEYIESTGTQYIDTGFKPSSATRLVADVEVLSGATSFLFGARANSSANSTSYSFSMPQISGTALRSDYGSAETSIAVNPMQRLSIDKNQNITTVNGITVSAMAQTFDGVCNLALLSVNTAGTINSPKTSARLYSCQIYDNGTLVRDYIPVQRVDGTVGLLDQVNYVFCPDAAGVGFVAGPVVPDVPAADPGFFVSLGVTMQAAVLVWGATTPGQSFRLYRNGALIYEGPGTYYTDSGLISDVTYSYRMAGFNGSEESTGLSLDIRTRDAVWLITDRTDRDTGDKGHYNCLDLIRVNEALDYVADLLRGAGYIVSVNTRKDWSMNDIPTVAQMEAYIQSIQNIKNTMEYLKSTPQPPRTMNRLTWQQANDIEQLLVDAEYTVFHIHDGLKRTGQFDAWCGPGPRFATAKHDDGRTWEELDAMETEWSGWDAATWYSLLYGHVRGEVS